MVVHCRVYAIMCYDNAMVHHSGFCIWWYSEHEAPRVVRLMRLAPQCAILLFCSPMVVYCGVYAIICYSNAMVHYSGFCM